MMWFSFGNVKNNCDKRDRQLRELQALSRKTIQGVKDDIAALVSGVHDKECYEKSKENLERGEDETS